MPISNLMEVFAHGPGRLIEGGIASHGSFQQRKGIFDNLVLEVEPSEIDQVGRIPRLGLYRSLGEHNRLAVLVLPDQRKGKCMVDITPATDTDAVAFAPQPQLPVRVSRSGGFECLQYLQRRQPSTSNLNSLPA